MVTAAVRAAHVSCREAPMSDQEIQDIVITANLTPRKCLGFKTPFQAILKELGKDVQIRFT
jgi:IS30 family transposase